MNKIVGLLMCMIAVGCATNDTSVSMSQQVVFVPNKSGLSDGENHASWTGLNPAWGKEDERLQVLATAGLGDSFPVADFKVYVKDGTDNVVVLELRSPEGTKHISVKRNSVRNIVMSGIEYTFSFPRVSVGLDAAEDVVNSDQVTLFVYTDKV